MTTPPTAMTTPEPLQIKLSVQQRRDFTACAQMCGLELAAWIVQCADVKAADAIDAMQAEQRTERPSRKPPKPRLRAEPPAAEASVARTEIRNRAAKDPSPSNLSAKRPVPRPAVETTAPKSTTSPVPRPAVEATAPKRATDPEIGGTGAGNSPKRARSGTRGATSKKAPSSETDDPLQKKRR